MDCPKCGAAQPDDREDCAACGIIFVRWRKTQERAMQEIAAASAAVPEPELEPGTVRLPRWIVITVLVLVLGGGVIWTARRRAARIGGDPNAAYTAQMNEINKAGSGVRARLGDANPQPDPRIAMQRALRAADSVRPVGLTHEWVQSQLQQCSGFRPANFARLPKRHHVHRTKSALEQYPLLKRAVDIGLMERSRDGDMVTYALRPGHRVSWRYQETDDYYDIELGRRRVVRIHGLAGNHQTAAALFEWTYEKESVWKTLSPLDVTYRANANLVFSGAWKIADAVIYEQGRKVALCP